MIFAIVFVNSISLPVIINNYPFIHIYRNIYTVQQIYLFIWLAKRFRLRDRQTVKTVKPAIFALLAANAIYVLRGRPNGEKIHPELIHFLTPLPYCDPQSSDEDNEFHIDDFKKISHLRI
jgi:hypothetical protein